MRLHGRFGSLCARLCGAAGPLCDGWRNEQEAGLGAKSAAGRHKATAGTKRRPARLGFFLQVLLMEISLGSVRFPSQLPALGALWCLCRRWRSQGSCSLHQHTAVSLGCVLPWSAATEIAADAPDGNGCCFCQWPSPVPRAHLQPTTPFSCPHAVLTSPYL